MHGVIRRFALDMGYLLLCKEVGDEFKTFGPLRYDYGLQISSAPRLLHCLEVNLVARTLLGPLL
jgi:hypothetical protein